MLFARISLGHICRPVCCSLRVLFFTVHLLSDCLFLEYLLNWRWLSLLYWLPVDGQTDVNLSIIREESEASDQGKRSIHRSVPGFFFSSFLFSFFQNAWRMSTSTKSSAASEKATQTTLEQTTDDLANLADARNQPLVIILAVTLPTLALIGLFIVLVVCYRRRHATIWLKKIGKSSEVHCAIRFSRALHLLSSIQNILVDYKRLLSIFLPRQSKLSTTNPREFSTQHWTSFISLDFQKREIVFLIDLSVNHAQKPSSTID